MDRAEELWSASIHINLEIDRTDRQTLERLNEIFKRHPGSCTGFVILRMGGRSHTVIALPEHLKLSAGAALKREVNGCVGYDAVETRCAANLADVLPPNRRRFRKKRLAGNA
jgi:DNA polymerase-3 subunit alpha